MTYYREDRARQSTGGYTLLEMIVSVGIFSVVMLIAAGAYLALLGLDRQARATSSLMTNLSFAIDSMERTIRTGSEYKCNNSSSTPNCTSPGGSFGFRDSDGRTIVYALSGGSITQSINGAAAVALTDPTINIPASGLRFYVRGVGNDDVQPQVIFTLRGSVTDPTGKITEFAVQSAATQRLLET